MQIKEKMLCCAFRWSLIFIILSLASSEEISKDACCKTIFLFATGAVGDHQSALMGRYTYMEEHDDKPYFTKTFQNKTYFFFYQSEEESGGPAWIVGSELGGLTLNIVARDPPATDINPELDEGTHNACPVGIKGAYDRNETYDDTFMVECEDSASTVESGPKCCSLLTVKAEGDISKNHIVRLGTYNKTGTFNGHALYHLHQYNFDSYLYFRKKGRSADGWTIGSEPGQETFSITTRNRTNCPNEVTTGYDRDKEADPTFSISCESEDGDKNEEIIFDLEKDFSDSIKNDIDKIETDFGKIENAIEEASTYSTATTTTAAASMHIILLLLLCTFFH